MHYAGVRPGQEPLRARIREIATARMCYGYRRVHVLLRRRGKPVDDAFIEAFDSLVTRECRSQHCFSALEEARHVLEAWRQEYNNHWPHGSLRDRTPVEYRAGGYFIPDRNRLLVLGSG